MSVYFTKQAPVCTPGRPRRNQRQEARRSHSIPCFNAERYAHPRRNTYTSRQTQMHLVELALRIFHSGRGSLFLVQRLTVCRLRVNPGSVGGGLLSVGRQVLLDAHVLLRRQVRCQSSELVCAHRGSKEQDGQNTDSQCRMTTLHRASIRIRHPPGPANARDQHSATQNHMHQPIRHPSSQFYPCVTTQSLHLPAPSRAR